MDHQPFVDHALERNPVLGHFELGLHGVILTLFFGIDPGRDCDALTVHLAFLSDHDSPFRTETFPAVWSSA